MLIEFDLDKPFLNYKILSNTINPRPIAWISTIDNQGVVNLAPFSFFAPISITPPIFSVCVGQKSDGSWKDTFRNIQESQIATICMCNKENLKAMENSSKELEYGVSEAVNFDIPLEIIHKDYPPIPKGVQVAFMCKLYKILEITQSSKPILLEAKEAYVYDGGFSEGLDFVIKNVGRVGKEFLC